MRIIDPGYEILTPISEGGMDELKMLEKIARVCYKSESHITEDGESAKKLITALIRSGHEAMLEHGIISVKFTVDRGVSHEIVRHRMASFAQESTRYCNYAGDKFGNELTFIRPSFFGGPGTISKYGMWCNLMDEAEQSYMRLIELGAKPEEARSVLPNSLKTEIVVTANYREWRHIFALRTSPKAHPQIREVMIPLMQELREKIPVIFETFEEETE